MRDATEAAYRGPATGPAVSRDQLSSADTAHLSAGRPSWPAVGRPRPFKPLENSLYGQAGELVLAKLESVFVPCGQRSGSRPFVQDCGSGSGSRRAKMTHKRRKKI
jgi:hypothetical protein